MKNQKIWVVKQLQDNGQVSRNLALKNYISRLGAIICDLNKNGWSIQGKFIKTNTGKDFVYFVEKTPYIKSIYYIKELNKYVTKYEKI